MKGSFYDRYSHTILAAGTVMEIWPIGNYSRYMSDPMIADSLESYWRNVNSYLNKAVMQYDQSQQAKTGKCLNNE